MEEKNSQSDQGEFEKWTHNDDFLLFKGIAKHGLNEWDQLIKDSELWGYLNSHKKNEFDYWKVLFRKIERKDVIHGQENNCEE